MFWSTWLTTEVTIADCTPGESASGVTVCTYRFVSRRRFRPQITTGASVKQITPRTQRMIATVVLKIRPALLP
jgi:hypothetical protein